MRDLRLCEDYVDGRAVKYWSCCDADWMDGSEITAYIEKRPHPHELTNLYHKRVEVP